MGGDETPEGVSFTNLDQPLFAGAEATKGDLVAYLSAVADRLVTELRDRPLSVIRVQRGQTPFMQKNLPPSTPSWVQRLTTWAETSRRDVAYALCNDRRTLMWLANQRAVEYHPALVRAGRLGEPLYLVLDLDPPSTEGFAAAVQAARLVREALAGVHLQGAVKTSGAKGVHVFVPVEDATMEEVAAASRAIAARAEQLDASLATMAFIKEDRQGKVFLDSTRTGWATVVAAYSPRARPGLPVSFPVSWDDLDRVSPQDFTIRTAPALLGDRDPWVEAMPAAQRLDAALVEEGRTIPLARVQAMHEGRRRARLRGSSLQG